MFLIWALLFLQFGFCKSNHLSKPLHSRGMHSRQVNQGSSLIFFVPRFLCAPLKTNKSKAWHNFELLLSVPEVAEEIVAQTSNCSGPRRMRRHLQGAACQRTFRKTSNCQLVFANKHANLACIKHMIELHICLTKHIALGSTRQI